MIIVGTDIHEHENAGHSIVNVPTSTHDGPTEWRCLTCSRSTGKTSGPEEGLTLNKNALVNQIEDLEEELTWLRALETTPDMYSMPNGTMISLTVTTTPEDRELHTILLVKINGWWYSTDQDGPDRAPWTYVLGWIELNIHAVHRTRIGQIHNLLVAEEVQW